MNKLAIFNILILCIILLSGIYFCYSYSVLYTEDFYYKYVVFKRSNTGFSGLYIDYDKTVRSEKDIVKKAIKLNELYKKYPELKKILKKAKILN